MALTLISTPEKTIGLQNSKAFAALAQAPYVFERRDIVPPALSALVDNGGLTDITTLVDVVAAGWQVGDRVYIGGANYGIEGKITAIPGIMLVETDIAFVSAVDPSNYVNNQTLEGNYRIELAILDENDERFPGARGSFFYQSPPNGDFFIDITAILRTIVFQLNFVNYKIEYRPVSTNLTSEAFAQTPLLIAVNARRSLMSNNGSNMWEFLPNEAPNGIGKFLTAFGDDQVYFKGFTNQNVQFIVDPDLPSRTTDFYRFYAQELDINKNPIGGVISGPAYVDDPTFIGVLQVDSSLVLPLDPSTRFLEIWVGEEGNPAGVECVGRQLIQVREADCPNQIMLEWDNDNGGTDYWLFDTEQIIERELSSAISFEKAITEDIEVANTTFQKEVLGFAATFTLQVDNLTFRQYVGILPVLRSNEVRVWLTADGAKKVSVVATTESFSFSNKNSTHAGRYSLAFDIKLPNKFDLSFVKEY